MRPVWIRGSALILALFLAGDAASRAARGEGESAPAAAEPSGAGGEKHPHESPLLSLKEGEERIVPHTHGMRVQLQRARDGEVRLKFYTPTSPIDWSSDLALFSLITFLVFLFVLGKFAWKPLNAALIRRETAIRDAIERAEQNRIQSEKLLLEHKQHLANVQEEVKAILAEARRDGEHTKSEIIAAAEREAALMRQRAITEIERARDQAMDEIFSRVGDAVADATEQVLGRAVRGGDQDRLIGEALAQFAHR